MNRGLKQYIYNLYGDLTIMKIILKNLFVILFLGLIPCGCNNDPTSPEEGHTDADGFVLEDENGNQIYREFEGATTGSVTINVSQSMELSVHFLDHDGNEMEHDEGEDDHGHDEGDNHADEGEELRISANDDAIAIIKIEEHCDEITNQTACEASEHCEWHSDEAKCEDEAHDDHDHSEEEEHHGLVIHITGVSVGSTSFKLELMHGDHADYTSTKNVPITVTAPN